MKNLFLKTLVLTLFATVALAADPWSRVYELARPSVVLIRTSGGICSGVLLEASTVLTARHCVHFLRPITVEFFKDDKAIQNVRATVLKWDKESDLALLKLETAVTYPTLKLAAKEELRTGVEQATIGHPFGIMVNFKDNLRSDFLFNLSVGRVSKINGDKNYLSGMSLSPGNSGGPVLTEKAEVIGVVSAKVGRSYAGDIGLIAHPVKIQNLISAPAKPPRAVEARGQMDWSFKHTQFSIVDDDRRISDAVSAAEIKFYLADRVLLSYEHSVSASRDDLEYEGKSLGYRWYLETENMLPYYVGVGLKMTDFKKFGEHSFVMVTGKALFLDIEAGVGLQDGGESFISAGIGF